MKSWLNNHRPASFFSQTYLKMTILQQYKMHYRAQMCKNGWKPCILNYKHSKIEIHGLYVDLRQGARSSDPNGFSSAKLTQTTN